MAVGPGLRSLLLLTIESMALCAASRSLLLPTIAATWDFGRLGIHQAIPLLQQGQSALDAVEIAIRTVELDTQDQYYVGVGGYPNALGVMELDAAIMDHESRYGAVMSLPRIATPISVARTVMEKCQHNILTGEGACLWAKEMGFLEEDILTESAKKDWEEWKASREKAPSQDEDMHDTVGVVCIDAQGRLAAGTSTSG
jgi:N4-(beta-N-acetylglucosaminyl)-L-asparaginase